MPAKNFIDRLGIKAIIKKQSGAELITKVLPNKTQNTNEKFLMCYADADIEISDRVLLPDGKEIVIQEVETQYWNGNPHAIHAYYEKQNLNANQVFNINSVSNSNIGNCNTLNIGNSINDIKDLINQQASESDKAALSKLINELEDLTKNSKDIQPGIFAKFSNVLQKNPWLTGPIGQILVSFVTKQF